MSEQKQALQQDFFEADVSWFHVMREMVRSGKLAEMEGSAVKVYMTIKAFTTFEDGRAFPAMDTIVKFSGVSLAQVRRCLRSLEEDGYLVTVKHGKRNTYELREQLQLTEPTSGEMAAMASFKYVPLALQKATDEIRNIVLKDPNLALGQRDGGVIHIDKINIQIIQQIGQNNTQNNYNANGAQKPDLSTKPS